MKRPSFITWEQLRVGLVIVIALTVITVAVFRLGAAAKLFSSRYTLITFVENANGLRVGGTVMIAGQLAGTVREIQFLPPDADTARNLRLVLEIDQALQDQVRADSRARLRTLGLLGDKVVDINPGTPRFGMLADGDTLLTSPNVDYDQVIAQASGAVGDLVELTGDLRTITGALARGEGTVGQLLSDRALYDELTSTLEQTNLLVSRMQQSEGTLGRLLDDPELYQRMSSAVGSMDSLLVQLNSEQGTLGRLLRDDTLYTRMVAIVSSADTLMNLLHSGEGFAAQLLTDQEMYNRLNQTIADLNAMLADVRSNPSRYTRGLIRIF